MPRLTGYSKTFTIGTLDDGLNRFAERTEDEYPNEICSSFSSSQDESGFNLHTSYSNALDQSDQSGQNRLQQTWRFNYHEAAIYLQEGQNNDKFDCHPNSKEAIPLYLLVHSTYFYSLDLFASVLLLLLVICEEPAMKRKNFSVR